MALDVKRLLQFIRRDWSLKLVFILVALVLWLYVVTGITYDHVIRVPISLENIQKGRVLAEELPERATVRYKGTGRALLGALLWDLLSGDLRLVVDVQTIKEFYDFPLQSYFERHQEGIHTPRGLRLELLEILSPETLKVRLDERITKQVPIASRVRVKTEPGYTVVGGVQLRPAVAEVSGPQRAVHLIDTLLTEVRLFDERLYEVNSEVRLETPDNPLVQFTPPRVEVFASVQSIVERKMPEIAVHVLNVPENLRAVVSPSSISLTLVGGIEFLTQLPPSDILAFVDYDRDWNPNQRSYTPNVEVPSDVLKWQEMRPPQVEVVVIRERR